MSASRVAAMDGWSWQDRSTRTDRGKGMFGVRTKYGSNNHQWSLGFHCGGQVEQLTMET